MVAHSSTDWATVCHGVLRRNLPPPRHGLSLSLPVLRIRHPTLRIRPPRAPRAEHLVADPLRQLGPVGGAGELVRPDGLVTAWAATGAVGGHSSIVER